MKDDRQEVNKERFLAHFKFPEGFGNGSLKVSREQAAKNMKGIALPTTKSENWKYTDLKEVFAKDFTMGGAERALNTEDLLVPVSKHHLIIHNGENESAGDGNNQFIYPLETGMHRHSDIFRKHYNSLLNNGGIFFDVLNTLYASSGAMIYLKKNEIAEEPIHIVNITSGKDVAYNVRTLIVAEQNSQATIVINSQNTGGSNAFHNSLVEVVLNEGAQINLILLQQEEDACAVNSIYVAQHNNSRFTCNTITLSGNMVRNNLNVKLNGTNCECELYGMYLPEKNQHVDNQTIIEHIQPHCNSNELYKGIAKDKAEAIFNGKVLVHPNAQKTTAFQENSNILFSDDAVINSKPELEIYADDVKCSHGSTTGKIDEDALFYLRSRGISRESAETMLVQAFFDDVIKKIPSAEIQNVVSKIVSRKLQWK